MALPVCFIKNHIFHTVELQVHLHSDVYQPPRGGNDSRRDTQVRSPQVQDSASTPGTLQTTLWEGAPEYHIPTTNSHVGVLMQGCKLVFHSRRKAGSS